MFSATSGPNLGLGLKNAALTNLCSHSHFLVMEEDYIIIPISIHLWRNVTYKNKCVTLTDADVDHILQAVNDLWVDTGVRFQFDSSHEIPFEQDDYDAIFISNTKRVNVLFNDINNTVINVFILPYIEGGVSLYNSNILIGCLLPWGVEKGLLYSNGEPSVAFSIATGISKLLNVSPEISPFKQSMRFNQKQRRVARFWAVQRMRFFNFIKKFKS